MGACTHTSYAWMRRSNEINGAPSLSRYYGMTNRHAFLGTVEGIFLAVSLTKDT